MKTRRKPLSWKEAASIAAQPAPETLIVTVDGKSIRTTRTHYVTAKTKQLREFGYNDLTESHVDDQLTAVLAGKEIGAGLTVIGGFMKGEVALAAPPPRAGGKLQSPPE